MYDKKPCIRYDAMVSPGCTLEHTIMYFLYLVRGSYSCVVNSFSSIISKVLLCTRLDTVRIGTSRPLKEEQRVKHMAF